MPVTPFHVGPGLLLKSAAPRALSATAFAAANVAVDIESVANILAGRYPVHAILHTLPAAAAVGLVAGLAVAAIGRTLRRPASPEWALRPALLGGLLGGASHPLLDGLMHRDIRPFLPLTTSNPLLGAVPLDTLHLLCTVAGVAGLAVLGWRSRRAPAG
ncbi:MAG TPA: metal-dependent hydrolase [Rubricoccaceae bacterium]